MMNAIEIQSIQKSYGNVRALNGLDLQICQGEFFGLLGPNGAGKTTLIHSIVGLVKPQAGEIRIFNQAVSHKATQARACIGFAPQEVNVDRFFNLRKTLEFQAGFYGYSKKFARDRAQEMLEQFRLLSKADAPFYRLSGGMQKRLLIARALMSKPKILILDEPSAGIDVEQRRELWEYLRDLNRDGTTIVLTTHYIDEAEALCERVAFINHGKIVEEGKPQELIEKHCEQQVTIEISESLSASLFEDLASVEVFKNRLCAHGNRIGPVTGEILKRVVNAGAQVKDIQVKHGSLEEVFVKLTGLSLQSTLEEAPSESPENNRSIL